MLLVDIFREPVYRVGKGVLSIGEELAVTGRIRSLAGRHKSKIVKFIIVDVGKIEIQIGFDKLASWSSWFSHFDHGIAHCAKRKRRKEQN